MLNQTLIPRTLAQILQKTHKSFLLLGPRQTGKSTLANSLQPDLNLNLARETTYLEFASNPNELEERLGILNKGTILIDEIQRLPSLLNTIQVILDEKPNLFRFILTGSSARKLKRGKANLLPGRINAFHLGPLTCKELNYHIDLNSALAFGTLPGVFTETNIEEKRLTLKTYAAVYLKEEIQAEALTKNIEGFSRFIYVTAAEASHFLDITKLSSEARITRQSAIRYFEILEDTMIVQRCEPFSKSTRKRLLQHPRLFFFDVGVLNGLLDNFNVSADRIGRLFEHFIFNQLMETAASHNESIRISSYRTQHGAEVDFIVEKNNEVTAIEVKASKNISLQDLRGLKNFQTYYGKPSRAVVLYLGEHPKLIENIEILPWIQFFKEQVWDQA
jgi:predicted AAA+ superfamily ATPase